MRGEKYSLLQLILQGETLTRAAGGAALGKPYGTIPHHRTLPNRKFTGPSGSNDSRLPIGDKKQTKKKENGCDVQPSGLMEIK